MVSSQRRINNRTEGFFRVLYKIYFGTCLLNIFLNIIASPIVKYVFLVQAFLVLIQILIGEEKNLIWVFMSLSLFEGQGRVLWGYSILFRLLFDILLGIMIIKGIVLNRKVVDRSVIPNYLLIGILLHFIWFILELFNPMGPSLFGAFATSKYFIFPFFLFFFFQMYPIDLNEIESQKKIQGIIVIYVLSAILVIIQNNLGLEHLTKISPLYLSLFDKFSQFVGQSFRPWGTSFGPGGMSTFFYTMVGIFFIYRPRVFAGKNTVKLALASSLKWSGLGFVFFASFISQVRSATLKTMMIFLGMLGLKFIGSRLKAKRAVTGLLIFLALGLASPFLSFDYNTEDLNIDKTVSRWSQLAEEGVSGNRANFDVFMEQVDKRVEWPLGYGLGMTQGFLPDYNERRKEHVEIPGFYFWHLDNLIFFLLLELGAGAIFYIFVLVSLNISLLSRMITLLRWREITAFSVLAISYASVLTMTVFCWGAVALPFNPESFFFWFWAALGFNVFSGVRDKRAKNSQKDKEVDESPPNFGKIRTT